MDYGWRRRRLAAVLAGIVVLGGMFAVTQFASAADEKDKAACEAALRAQQDESNQKQREEQQQRQKEEEDKQKQREQEDQQNQQEDQQNQEDGQNQENGQNQEDGQKEEQPPGDVPPPEEKQPSDEKTPTDEVTPPKPEEQAPPPECEDVDEEDQPKEENNGLDVQARDCEKSRLDQHKGFQDAPRCVTTAMGEVSEADQNPSLLITSAPERVRVNKAFQLKISSRNLVRTRFLAAGLGGYYLETSILTDEGLQQGHMHVSCRMLKSERSAPKPEPVPAFFKAVEDGKGGGRADTVTVEVPGLPQTGTAQCAVWAGDNTHRIPMMQRANQQPAFDTVRVEVTRR